MARMPGAKWRPISRNYTKRRTAKDCILLHTTAAAKATSQYGWFNTPGANASSHFHVDFAGNIEQYIDSDYFSWANSAANPRSVTIETQGAGHEPWTVAQIKAIVAIIVWARKAHPGIPLRQMTSSAASQKGIGWHRLGVNGNFPRTGILRGRTQRGGGQVWSSAYGKVCPGDKRIQQVPAIIRQAGGHNTPAAVAPKPKIERTWFDMASVKDLENAVKRAVPEASIEVTRSGKKTTRSLGTLINNLDVHAAKIGSIPDAVLKTQVPVQRSGKKTTRSLGTLISGQDASHNRQAARLAALEDLVQQLAAGQGIEIDYEKVQEAAKRGAAEAIEEADGN